MTQRFSGAIAISLIAMLWFALAGFALERVGFELLGYALTPVIMGLCLAVLVGFIGGAIKQGGFKRSFFWGYVITVVLATLLSVLGTYDCFFLGRC